MQEKELEILLQKYMEGKLNVEELAAIRRMAVNEGNAALFNEALAKVMDRNLGAGIEAGADLTGMYNDIVARERKVMAPVHRIHFLRTAWFRYAAAIILLAGVGGYLWMSRNEAAKEQVAKAEGSVKADIPPGCNKAVLTLADGSTILLDEAADGSLAQQGGTKIVKLNGGALAYTTAGKADLNAPALYNTVSTPKGGQYQVILPDGTKVWLNAASGVRFPATFNDKERRIEIMGEAYLEIAPDKGSPFFVNARNTEVQVLGTSFNINAYQDEEVLKTTLLEGSVRLNKGTEHVIMKPGQQALIAADAAIRIKPDANVAEAIAWKNGLFTFDEAGVPAIMRQLSRWYNVDVVYEGAVPEKLFVGKIFREMSLSQVLKVLGNNGISCRISGRKILVAP